MTLKERTAVPISVDCIIFGYSQGQLQVALIERKKAPFIGEWALPGGFLIDNETVEETAARELEEETGLRDIYLEQFHVFSNPQRDPRGRVITVGFFALISSDNLKLIANEDAAKACWFNLNALPKLCFDHEIILDMGVKSLQAAVEKRPLVFELLPRRFSLTDLQILYEEIFFTKFDKRNFRKKILSLGILKATKKQTTGEKHRPAQLYEYNKKAKSWKNSFI